MMPPNSVAADDGFHLSNWWRNGVACRLTVIVALLILANLFEPWTPGYWGSGYPDTQWEGNERVRRDYQGVKGKGAENAFTEGQGWLPHAGISVILLSLGAAISCAIFAGEASRPAAQPPPPP